MLTWRLVCETLALISLCATAYAVLLVGYGLGL